MKSNIWNQKIRPEVLERDNYKCNNCGVTEHSIGERIDGKFIPIGGSALLDLAGEGLSYPSLERLSYKEGIGIVKSLNENLHGDKYLMICLTVGNKDEDLEINKLKSLCPQCRIKNDFEKNLKKRQSEKYQTSLFPIFQNPKPQRIQMKRGVAGWSLQEVSKELNGLQGKAVTRPHKWGNPFKVEFIKLSNTYHVTSLSEGIKINSFDNKESALNFCLNQFKELMELKIVLGELNLNELKGKNLACFCSLDSKCHADILLELANK